MSDLPIGWVGTTLAPLIERIEAGLNVKCEERPPEPGERGLVKISAVTWGRFDESKSKTLPTNMEVNERNRIHSGDLLISRANTIELVGATVIVEEVQRRLYLSDKVLRLVVYEPSKRWVNYALKVPAMRKAIEAASSGNQLSMRNIPQEKLRGLTIPLAPESEQTRIADKLDAVLARVDACRDRLDRIPVILKRFRQSVLAAATSGRLTDKWRRDHLADTGRIQAQPCLSRVQLKKREWLIKNAAHNESSRVEKRLDAFVDSTPASVDLPSSWRWAALEDACLMVVDCHNKTAPYENEGIALVRTTNIRDGHFVWEGLRFVSEETYRFWSKRCFPKQGDIMFTREAPMGEAAIIPADMKLCLGQRTMLIRPVEECVSAQYLLITLLDPNFKERSEQTAVGTGVKHFRVGDVSELKVPIPPTDEQAEIVRRVESLFAYADRLEARYTTARTQVEKFTPSLLAKAFRGELVPQDSNDEPASALLARISASRPDKTRKKSVVKDER